MTTVAVENGRNPLPITVTSWPVSAWVIAPSVVVSRKGVFGGAGATSGVPTGSLSAVAAGPATSPAPSATTLTVYRVPATPPSTQVRPVVSQLADPGLAVTRYFVTAAPPAGAAHVTTTEESSAVAATEVGAPGGP